MMNNMQKCVKCQSIYIKSSLYGFCPVCIARHGEEKLKESLPQGDAVEVLKNMFGMNDDK